MKRIAIVISLLIGIFWIAEAQDKQVKADEIKQLIESQQFKFTARSANPLIGGRIDLTSTYDFTVDSMKVEAWLPYYGRAYRIDYGSTNGGIKFKETAESIDISLNKKENAYKVKIVVDTKNDYYQIYLEVGLAGYGILNISSNNRQSISFYGIIEPLD
ncbi:DUF4251 domain-containing protein [Sunxiuqinia sp. A32]|uniref:DUF4251 domain-containing protein n=1 Tax=Sunxiuqinia sp. A32 TaxID=3461496 RepID=UPI00404642F3